MEKLESVVKVAAPLGVFAVFFFAYFRHFVFRRSIILQSRAFFLGLFSASLTMLVQRALHQLLPADNSPLIEAFLHASAIEELVRFLFIYNVLRRSSETFTAVEGVFDGILIGLGFAVAENLYYAAGFPGYVILLRSLTCIPLHAFLSGIMAWFVSMSLLSSPSFLQLQESESLQATESEAAAASAQRTGSGWLSLRRYRRIFAALFWPILIHGLYDWMILRGGAAVYLISPLLIIGMIWLELTLAQARVQFGRNVLQMIGIDADDLDVALAQREYEKRLDEMQEAPEETPQLLLSVWGPWRTAAGVFFLLAALAAWLLHDPLQLPRRLPDLDGPLIHSLFSLFPAAVAVLLLLSDKINFLYFRDLMLRTPAVCGAAVARQDGREVTLSLFDLRPTGVFLSALESFADGEILTLRFGDLNGQESDGLPGRWRPISVRGQITWSNRRNRSLPVGHVCRYQSRPLRFIFYRWNYQIVKFVRRLGDLRR
ncbi:MAG: PrsW family intramembrane metalloprotease [Leptospirales bacterium]|nr:PrsW family intramembrane metalloprotease [Leptospirales bacterium]